MRRRLVLAVGVGSVAALTLGACSRPTPPPPAPAPAPATSTAPPVPRLRIGTTEPVRTFDPAAALDPASALLAINTHQRLLTTKADSDGLKPDLAFECLFVAETTYSCSLRAERTWPDGRPVGAEDVKWSIERAIRLDVGGQAKRLFASLRSIDTSVPGQVRFHLHHVDNGFSQALAMPVASIVERGSLPADRVGDRPVAGAGPYVVKEVKGAKIMLARNLTYVGLTPAKYPRIEWRTFSTSDAVQRAMADGDLDVVWRGLDEKRGLGEPEPEDHPTPGPTGTTSPTTSPTPTTPAEWPWDRASLAGARVQRVEWETRSRWFDHAAVRTFVRDALWADPRSERPGTPTPTPSPSENPSATSTARPSPTPTGSPTPAATPLGDPTTGPSAVPDPAAVGADPHAWPGARARSMVPPGFSGHVDVVHDETSLARSARNLPRGVRLVLGYDSRVPDQAERAELIARQLERSGRIEVEVTGDRTRSDLTLVDVRPGASTTLGWYDSYLSRPLPRSTRRIDAAMAQWRRSRDAESAGRALETLQRLATADATVVPLWQGEATVLVHQGWSLQPTLLTTGNQFGMWGVARG